MGLLMNIATKPRVLLMEDDGLVRGSLSRALRSEGFEVVWAEKGAVGRTAAQETPAILLLDVDMPDTDGWEEARMVGRECSLIPMVVITARTGEHRRADWAGAKALMEKPLDFPTLLRLMRQLIARARADDPATLGTTCEQVIA